MPRGRVIDGLWLAASIAAASAYCLLASRQLGATFDEFFYVHAGLEHWRTGSYGALLRGGTMPLAPDVQTLPLYLYERFHGITLYTDTDFELILPYARLGTLLFLSAALVYGSLIGRTLAGPWGGRLAVAWLALEPNLLAHSTLATTDVAITAGVLALAYHYARNRERSSWLRRVGVPGIWFGLALLAKASAIVFGPVTLLVIEWRRLHRAGAFHGGGPLPARLRRYRAALAPWHREMWAIGLLGLLIAVLYCGTDWRVHHPFLAWARRLPEGNMRDAAVNLAVHLRIFPNALSALLAQVLHNTQGHAAYVAGMTATALWFYFPLLLTIKMTLPFLGAAALVALTRTRALGNWPFLTFAVLLALSVTFRVQIGLRMVLPAVALGLVGVAVGLTTAIEALGPRTRRAAMAIVVAGVSWNAVTLVRQFPHALTYTNELWGSTREGYRSVSDANYDWGQGLKELRQWQSRHRVTDLSVWYFGTDPLARELPMTFSDPREARFRSADAFLREMRGRYLAVSTTYLYGGYASGTDVVMTLLRSRQPAARTQTFLIYDFTD
jgi:4-amino-4-deoxy-L-arabinose transferase-like glycosyltransferase